MKFILKNVSEISGTHSSFSQC